MMTKAAIAALLALGVGAGTAAAQEHHGQPADTGGVQQPTARQPAGMGMMQHMRGGMMGNQGATRMPDMATMPGMTMMPNSSVVHLTMRLSPTQVLKLQETLTLTPEQVSRLENLMGNPVQDHREKMATVAQAQTELERLFNAESPDPKRVRAAAEKLFSTHAAMQARRIANAATVRAILTPAQRELAVLQSSCPMHGMNGGMMQAGMMPVRSPGSAPQGQHQEHHGGS